MTEIIKYQAYDGTIFEDKNDCLDYEDYAWDMFNEIITKARFNIGSSDKTIAFDYGDLNFRLQLLEDWYNSDADEITITDDISDSAIAWLRNNLGFSIPYLRGFYKYDFDDNKWDIIPSHR